MANGWGGKRAGSGRKKTAVKHQGPIESALSLWIAALPELAEIWLEKAKGGDKEVLKDLFNRIMGRPTESLELTGDEARPVVFRYVRGDEK